MARLAVTGIASFLGGRLLRRLAEDRGGDAVVAVDVAAPPAALKVRRHALDLTTPASDQRLLEVFREEDVDTVLHFAFLTSPHRDASFAHELESIGTLNLLAASAAAGVRHFVLRSFTAVYGPSGRNPGFLTEDRALQPDAGLAWVREKLEVEQHAAAFARRYPDMRVTVLRFAPLFGPGVHTFYTRLFDHRVVPVLMGYDPLLQLLHPDDALAAALRAVERAPGGPFNVVPSRPIPLLTALHLAHKIPVAVPHPIASAATDLLWGAGLAEAPGAFVNYARYPCLGDPAKARQGLGFEARHSSRDALFAYLRYRYAHPAFRSVEATA